MAKITFANILSRHLTCPPQEVSGKTVGAALAQVFQKNPNLRGYLLDDQGQVRKHVAIFLNQHMLKDRRGLSDPLAADDEIHVLQSLTGG